MRPSITPRRSRSKFGLGRMTGASFGGRGMVMKRSIGALALLTIGVLLPAVAEARGYSRGNSGYVNTPFGSMPMSVMRQAGGNPIMAQEMYQQQLMYQQQQMMM